MEELLKHPIVTHTLSPVFNQEQWSLLAQQSPSSYRQHMHAINQQLDQQMPSLATEYYRFIQNQRTIAQWYDNSPSAQSLIEPYLFQHQKTTPAKPISKQRPLKAGSAAKLVRTEPSAVRKFFAETLAMSAEHKEMELQAVNSYELYMETFSACRGKRYAAYDYQRHMRSQQERSKYNNFIRVSHKRNLSIPVNRKNNRLECFEEWSSSKHQKKSSLLNVRKILSDLSLNSEKGINQLLRSQGTTKLVLLNHQRKPINYYLRSKPKPLTLTSL